MFPNGDYQNYSSEFSNGFTPNASPQNQQMNSEKFNLLVQVALMELQNQKSEKNRNIWSVATQIGTNTGTKQTKCLYRCEKWGWSTVQHNHDQVKKKEIKFINYTPPNAKATSSPKVTIESNKISDTAPSTNNKPKIPQILVKISVHGECKVSIHFD